MKYEMLMMDARREGLEEGRAEGLKKGHEKGRAEGIKIGEARVRDKGINTLIKNLQELNVNQSMIKQRVKDSYDLSDEELAKYFD